MRYTPLLAQGVLLATAPAQPGPSPPSSSGSGGDRAALPVLVPASTLLLTPDARVLLLLLLPSAAKTFTRPYSTPWFRRMLPLPSAPASLSCPSP